MKRNVNGMRTIALVLAAVLVLGSVPAALAAEAETGEEGTPNNVIVTYDEETGTYTYTVNADPSADPSVGSDKPETVNISFPDVNEGDWYYDAVMALARSGIIVGKGNGVFDPNAVITRGEMAALICRLDARVNAVRFAPGESISTYTLGERTYNETTSWAHEYMMGLYDKAGGVAHPIYPIWDPESYGKPVYRGEAAEICWVFATRMTRYVKTIIDDDGELRFYPYKTNERYRIADGAVGLNFSSVELVSYIPDVYTSTACNEMGCGVKYPNGKDKVRDHDLMINALKWAYLLDIMHGVDAAGNSNAHGNLTRAEFCQMLYNMQLTSGDNIGNPRYVPNDYYVVKGFGAK